MTSGRPKPARVTVGDLVELDVGAPAHGGSCVARREGQVYFVRHALPGERVRALVTEQAKTFARADAVEVVSASAHRVTPRCPVARPGGCGGCDWQHAELSYQRELKAAVVAEQLRRLAGLDRPVVVEALPGDGFGWRTRVRFAVDATGRAGFRKHRSHEVVPVEQCPIAHPLVEGAGVEAKEWNRASEVEVVASTATGHHLLRTTSRRDGAVRATGDSDALDQAAGGRRFRVRGGGFWQVHPGAADLLAQAVLDGLRPRSGERALDLYAGVGLFAAALADAVGAAGSVTAIEGGASAADDAAHNLADLPNVQVVHGEVGRELAGFDGARRVDLVVLDPPRNGARAAVVNDICRLAPRAVAYVACDPAALARDVATFATGGYRLAQLRAFDLFPQTHHVECVALLERLGPVGDGATGS